MTSKGKHLATKEEVQGLAFGAFRLTQEPLRLWRGRREVKLQARPLAVLRYLVEHASVVVSREELLEAVWNGIVVTPAALQICIRAVRMALGDNARAPRYIETVGREGYRFIAAVATGVAPVSRSTFKVPSPPPPLIGDPNRSEKSSFQPGTWDLEPGTCLVGREAELTQLHTLFTKALAGERQLVFITGEAGIGKTTVVDAFLAGIRQRTTGNGQATIGNGQQATGNRSQRPSSLPIPDARSPMPEVWMGRGQCLEHYGEGEPYLPVLEAIGQLCQQEEGGAVLAALRRYAPTWLLHLPGVIEAEEQDALQRRGAGATQGQMVREMAEALEAASAECGVILVLEDLHVSDPSTVELLAYLAQRRGPAHLLILGTYRPVDIVLSEHPLRARAHELVARGYAQSLALDLLNEAEVAAYLRQRLATTEIAPVLVRQVYERTDGNALFMVSTVEHLLHQQRLTNDDGDWRLVGDMTATVEPESLKQLLLAQIDSLPMESQRVLEAASVVGPTFTVAHLAAGLPMSPDAIDDICESLMRGQFIVEHGLETWPDGTISGHYGFRHVLYQEVLYQRLGAGRRVRLHLAIGVREEAGYREHAKERAAELARHFTEGQDITRALHYRVQAGKTALARAAHVEAQKHCTHGLILLNAQPAPSTWRQHELWLQMGLGVALMATKGFAALEVEQALQRAHVLCQQLGEIPEHLPVVTGLWAFAFTRGVLRRARQLAEQTLRIAESVNDPALLGVAHANMQATLYFQGDFALARVHGEQAYALAMTMTLPSQVFSYEIDPSVRSQSNSALVSLTLGYVDQALQRVLTALAHARELGQIQTLGATLQFVASVCSGRQEWQEVQKYGSELITFATTYSLPFWWANGTINFGIATAQLGDPENSLNQIKNALAMYRMIGAELGLTRALGWQAEISGQVGQVEEGLATLAEAFQIVERNDEHAWEAELYRRKGELTLQQGRQRAMGNGQQSKVADPRSPTPDAQSEAESCFLNAIDIARQQQAKLWELRATMSLVRLRRQQVREHAVHDTAHGLHAALSEARTMLAEVYNWFTEGLETQDLQEARALLTEARL